MAADEFPPVALGATPLDGGTRFAVWSGAAERVWLCLFDAGDRDERIELSRDDAGVFSATVAGIGAGARYGFRADGRYDPAQGFWFDPDKLLMDPYVIEIDRPYRYDLRLAARRGEGMDTAELMPKGVVRSPTFSMSDDVAPPPLAPPHKGEGGSETSTLPSPLWGGVRGGGATGATLGGSGATRGERIVGVPPGGQIYELNVRAFTALHPDVPEAQRGTIAALAHPAVIEHLTRLGVSAVELMPVTAWIDERHLPPLGLTNAWGYNPVSFMALDPRLALGGVRELRETVSALHAAGIYVILDLVFNHTGESDALGPTLSLRGLDARTYFRHAPDGGLVNDTGCGNTICCDHPVVRRLILDSLRHFVLNAGVDGFRFDLAPILGRTDHGFDPNAALITEIANDPVLAERVLIAEPWDIGPGGYQLGNFPAPFLEWNDRYRDDLRRFWRGDRGMLGALATRLAGSSDVFARHGSATTRTVNFLAAHDGMTLADLVAFERKHNAANGEDNRDGHDENLSWNNGVEGKTDDPEIAAARKADIRALLATLFLSRGTIMLTAGDEFGRSQGGNNNAYAQEILARLDWSGRDRELESFTCALGELRQRSAMLRGMSFLSGEANEGALPDIEWLGVAGAPMTAADWESPDNRRLAMVLSDGIERLAILINGDRRRTTFGLPPRDGRGWKIAVASGKNTELLAGGGILVDGRSVTVLEETVQAMGNGTA